MIESLESYSELLNKSINTILDEALSQYFDNEAKKILEKDSEASSMMTNLDFDEFWDGVDI
jgi:tRNA A37 N6-isopentenylltransferase MiaA